MTSGLPRSGSDLRSSGASGRGNRVSDQGGENADALVVPVAPRARHRLVRALGTSLPELVVGEPTLVGPGHEETSTTACEWPVTVQEPIEVNSRKPDGICERFLRPRQLVEDAVDGGAAEPDLSSCVDGAARC